MRVIDARRSSGNTRVRHAAFTIALVAVILQFLFSGNTLAVLGIDYASAGGNPLFKLHPATYLIALAAFMVLLLQSPSGSGLVRFFHAKPALASFLVLITFCMFYSVANVGFSGAATYIESYVAAGLLAVVLEDGTERQKRALAWWIIGFCVLNIIISIGESATQTHLIELHVSDEPTTEMTLDSDEFRGAGLFGHPLTAALVTSMSTFMLLRMRMNGLLKAGLFTFLLVGLLSFGGRAALATTVVLLTGAAAVVLVRGIVRRNLSIEFIGMLVAAIVILPLLTLVLVTSTDIGARVISHMYLDDSAQVRSTQWEVLNYLNLNDVLFGVTPDRLFLLKYQIGLGNATTDIENFWLLMFLNLGAIGFVVFLIALALLIAHLGRTTAHPLGWMLLIAAILIDSSSNSLGRKSADLVFMVACITAMTGFLAPEPARMASVRRKVVSTTRQMPELLGTRPSHGNLAGLKS